MVPNSGPGTQTLPFLTLQKAANIVKPGDTVIVGDGTYTTPASQFIEMSRAGTGSAWVTFRAQHNYAAKLNGQNNATPYMMLFDPGNGGFVRIQNFEIYGFSGIAIVTSGSHDIDIVGNYIHDIGRYCTDSDNGIDGVYGNSSPNVTIEWNVFQNIGRYSPGENGCQPKTAYWQNHDHGVYLNGMNNTNITNNIFYNLQHGWGIQVYSDEGYAMTNMLVRGNAFYGENPNRNGQIALAGNILKSTIVNNTFYSPLNYALYWGSTTYTYVNLAVTNNVTVGGSISGTPPAGVTLSGNN